MQEQQLTVTWSKKLHDYSLHSAWSESVRRGIAVRFPVHDSGSKCRRSSDRSAGLVVAKHRRITEIRGLETRKFGFSPQWRRKLLSVPVFTPSLNSASQIWLKGHKYRGGMRTTLRDFWGQILIHFKIMQMSYVNAWIKIFVALCRHTCLLPSRQKLVIFVENWNI